MSIVVLGLSHRSSPVTVREKFAFAEAELPAELKGLRGSGVADEAVILSTCNRVEVYAATQLEPGRAFAALKQFLLRSRGCEEILTEEIYSHCEPLSVQHLFK